MLKALIIVHMHTCIRWEQEVGWTLRSRQRQVPFLHAHSHDAAYSSQQPVVEFFIRTPGGELVQHGVPIAASDSVTSCF